MGWCIIQRWEDGCIQRERQDCWRFRRHGWAAQIWRRILAIKGKLVDKKVIFAIRVTTDFETFVLSPPLKKTILLIPTWRFYCLYVFLKINVGISRVFFFKGGGKDKRSEICNKLPLSDLSARRWVTLRSREVVSPQRIQYITRHRHLCLRMPVEYFH